MRIKHRVFGRSAKLTPSAIVTIAAVSLASTASLAEGPNPQVWPDALDAATTGEGITVFTAKNIYTMDPGRPEAEAIAVLDGKVLSVGTLDSMKTWLTRYKYTVDKSLFDKIILPGFIEPHTHV